MGFSKLEHAAFWITLILLLIPISLGGAMISKSAQGQELSKEDNKTWGAVITAIALFIGLAVIIAGIVKSQQTVKTIQPQIQPVLVPQQSQGQLLVQQYGKRKYGKR